MQLITRRTLSRVARDTPYASYNQRYAPSIWRCYSETTHRTYDDAISLLNTLQTPYAELKRQWDAGIKRGESDLVHTRDCFSRMGYEGKDLNKLNIVHVAGTKGKGTVCGYVDSILNQVRTSHTRDLSPPSKPGFKPRKVGLYTSPHLISVRERIRINSAPISETLFTKYFFQVWDRLCQPGVWDQPKPVYFRFLTLMSFHAFLSEDVDCAIYEVGMGGEYDATNIVERPAVTGISALGIDHTFHLGNTIDQIAWHKAGIFKKNVPAYTVEQPREAMAVVSERALKAQVDGLFIVKEDPFLKSVRIRPEAPFQRQNASLAIALSKDVLRKINSRENVDFPEDHLPEEFVRGLEQVVSRGRCEVRDDGNVIWYLDGAHTADSIIIASKWFCDEVKDKPEPRVLIFNQQGHRESMELLEGLFAATRGQTKFDHVIFCPSVPPASSTRKDHVNLQTDLEAVAGLTVQQKFADRWRELDASPKTTISVLPSLEDAFEYARKLGPHGKLSENGEGGKVRVFITGSIHLVGRALSMLEGVDAL
ncbi:hypothetical protein EG329_008084 [Mollisiaceae sp. DMI_Dod_QoI]|nr:hypothetical protein EG329_008084 [Helotiales sp. DMI_Dod_QoI]